MSYEGYVQGLCKNGHLDTWDCYDNDPKECAYCKAPMVWFNSVDETNCDGCGYIEMDKLLLVPAKTEVCNLGHVHEISLPIFRIPSPEETKDLQTYRDSCGELNKLHG